MDTIRKEIKIFNVINPVKLIDVLGYVEANTLMYELGIGPRILEHSIDGDKAYIVMPKYKYTLNEYPKSTTLRDNILRLIDKMHSSNIIHGDLHEENIVLNNENDIAIIDYDMAFSLNYPNIDNYVTDLFDVTNATSSRIKRLDKIEILRYFQ